MNYYDEIKSKLIDNEIYEKVKDYSKERNRVKTYYEVGKLLSEAGKHYGENIIGEYSKKLVNDVGKKYSVRYLYDMRKLYLFLKLHPLSAILSMSHYKILFRLDNDDEINYYIKRCTDNNLSKRQLETIIKSNEYERLPEETKIKLIENKELEILDEVKNPIIIKNNSNIDVNNIKETTLKQLILNDIPSFLKQLGSGYSFIDSEYKIQVGNTYNYIDILLYNVIYHSYVVVELKVTELKKEHIGQIEIYINYIDYNLRGNLDNRTIGLIVVRENNNYVIMYSSDKRIKAIEYDIKGD